jgi:hypothetical protein
LPQIPQRYVLRSAFAAADVRPKTPQLLVSLRRAHQAETVVTRPAMPTCAPKARFLAGFPRHLLTNSHFFLIFGRFYLAFRYRLGYSAFRPGRFSKQKHEVRARGLLRFRLE